MRPFSVIENIDNKEGKSERSREMTDNRKEKRNERCDYQETDEQEIVGSGRGLCFDADDLQGCAGSKCGKRGVTDFGRGFHCRVHSG